LPGVRTERLNIPSLTFCIDSIKSQGRLTTSADPGKYDKLIPWDHQIYVLQIMYPGAGDF